MSARALALLVETSAAHHGVLVSHSREAAVFSVAPPLPSGAPAPVYQIRVVATGSVVTAHEVEPARLPSFCPERHINPDGSFCLFWGEAEKSTIETIQEASGWWTKLLAFLRRQESVRVLRRWPGRADAWAHGPRAARCQARAEEAADALGDPFPAALRAGRLTTQPRRHMGGDRVRLLLDGERVASVIKPERRVMTLRSRCRCASAAEARRILRACGDHAVRLAELTLALEEWQAEEKRFFERIAKLGVVCCGTVDDCPLAA